VGNLEEGMRWLDQAGADLKTAEDCMVDGAPYTYYTKEIGERCVNYAELILEEARKYLKK